MKKSNTKTNVSKSVLANMIVIHTLLNARPQGRKMFIYTEALFTFLGAFTGGRKAFSKANMKHFYKTASIFTHHVRAGNIEKTKSGDYRLTATGLNFFSGRRNTKAGGVITDKDVKAAIDFIKTGNTKDTEFVGMPIHKAKIYMPSK